MYSMTILQGYLLFEYFFELDNLSSYQARKHWKPCRVESMYKTILWAVLPTSGNIAIIQTFS